MGVQEVNTRHTPNEALEATGHSVRFLSGVSLYPVARASAWSLYFRERTVTWLLNRLFDHQKQPTPRFAFQGTVNWMRALSILVDEGAFSHDSLRGFYNQLQRRQLNQEADTLAFECLLMAVHNASAIQAARALDEPYSFVRSAIVAWYYAIYYASKSMIAAATGGDPQTHSKTGKIWQTDIATKNLAVTPFDFNFADLTPANIEQVIAALRGRNPHGLNTTPTNREQAFGAATSYLRGTAEYEKWRLEEEVKDSAEFKRRDLRTLEPRQRGVSEIKNFLERMSISSYKHFVTEGRRTIEMPFIYPMVRTIPKHSRSSSEI